MVVKDVITGIREGLSPGFEAGTDDRTALDQDSIDSGVIGKRTEPERDLVERESAGPDFHARRI
jgi:hypothetical protein